MSKTSENERLDQLLVSLGHFASRSRARDAIARGTVSVNGKTVTKPSQTVAGDAEIAISDPAQAYVSRAALKLVAALDHFRLDPSGHECLDVGASTGGFTEVLLERGLLAKQRTEIALSSIRSVRITQTFGQRLFDVGNVELFSAGDVAEIAIRNMPRPGRIRAIAAARNLDLLPQR